jgi:hypothetical protein
MPRSKGASMTSSGTSTERRAARADSGFQPWHFFMLLAMLGATVAVWRSPDTHPAALLLLSAAVIAAGFVGLALYHALAGFVSRSRDDRPLTGREREDLLREKALVLRSIKELEFDRGMGKVNDADFAEIGGRLRARALELMQAIERTPAPGPPVAPSDAAAPICAACQTENDGDARFCKQCGARL